MSTFEEFAVHHIDTEMHKIKINNINCISCLCCAQHLRTYSTF